MPTNASPHFVGAKTCSSSSCHGGADERSKQFIVWSKLDFHSRAFATLTSARSERFAEVLKLGDATKSSRCTDCHAPMQTVPEKLRSSAIITTLGVSCENCHGPAEHWLRSHTRPDFTHDDRVVAGMRDLKNLYVRANTCVACHQTLDTDIARAGHPELIFELDGQSVSEPKHWREKNDLIGPQSWLVGQAVALREMSWQLSRESNPDENLITRWNGLLWLLQKIETVDSALHDSKFIGAETKKENFENAKQWSDSLARSAAKITWTKETTQKCLALLAASSPDFENKNISTRAQARRAERLVMGLDRLATSLDLSKTADGKINQLYKLVQSLPDFNPSQFASALKDFSAAISEPAP